MTGEKREKKMQLKNSLNQCETIEDAYLEEQASFFISECEDITRRLQSKNAR